MHTMRRSERSITGQTTEWDSCGLVSGVEGGRSFLALVAEGVHWSFRGRSELRNFRYHWTVADADEGWH